MIQTKVFYLKTNVQKVLSDHRYMQLYVRINQQLSMNSVIPTYPNPQTYICGDIIMEMDCPHLMQDGVSSNDVVGVGPETSQVSGRVGLNFLVTRMVRLKQVNILLM